MSSKKKIKLADALVGRGLCQTDKLANAMVLAKQVKVDDAFVTQPTAQIGTQSKIEVVGVKQYVSRGGYKLAHALEEFGIDVADKNCLDIGSSTGGFSDCLLQAGAGRIACVDVNYGQLDWKIRTHERTDVFERTNIKNVSCSDLRGPFDIVVIDVSFIGLATLVNKLSEFCKSKGRLIALVKPQFEARSAEVIDGRVDDEHVRQRTLEEVEAALKKYGFKIENSCQSPIKGLKKQNIEYLITAIKI